MQGRQSAASVEKLADGDNDLEPACEGHCGNRDQSPPVIPQKDCIPVFG